MAGGRAIGRERADRIARAHACSHCLEYSFKKIAIRRAPPSHQADLKTLWIARRVCGICGLDQELGLDAEGDIIYGG